MHGRFFQYFMVEYQFSYCLDHADGQQCHKNCHNSVADREEHFTANFLHQEDGRQGHRNVDATQRDGGINGLITLDQAS